MAELELHVFTVGNRRVLSVLPPQDVPGRLPPEALVGELLGDAEDVSADTFVPNQTFHALLHWVVLKHGPASPALQAAALRARTGHLVVIDRRTRAAPAQVPPQDVLGSFVVEDGILTGYALNPDHQLWTPDGFPDLDDHVHARLLMELRGLAAAG